MINIVLHEPGIAQNTGNIGRTCAATESPLHLIRPYGFRLGERELKRAGMDYWEKVQLSEYVDYEEFLEKHPEAKVYYATTKAEQAYTDVRYEPDCFIMFGNESRGIPEEILIKHPKNCVRIPMWGDIRSLNLANSVAIILYEALRQNGFPEMERRGRLHRLRWEQTEK